MTNDEIRSIVKHSIAKITSISPEEIPDNASYKSDLKLDSLTILEIAVDAEYQFKIKIPEDDLGAIDTTSSYRLNSLGLCENSPPRCGGNRLTKKTVTSRKAPSTTRAARSSPAADMLIIPRVFSRF